jgi:uncharacterized ParB-like nuclease family protein
MVEEFILQMLFKNFHGLHRYKLRDDKSEYTVNATKISTCLETVIFKHKASTFLSLELSTICKH